MKESQERIITGELEAHPAAEIMPMMTEEEFDDLKKSIGESGLLDAITLYEGKILDGRNRYAACKEVGAEILAVDWSGDDPVKFVVDRNINRRQLTLKQRFLAGMEGLKYQAELAKRRQVEAGKDKAGNLKNQGNSRLAPDSEQAEAKPKGRAVEIMAKQVNVGSTSFYDGKFVLENGTREEVEAFKTDSRKIDAHAKKVRARIKEEKGIVKMTNQEIYEEVKKQKENGIPYNDAAEVVAKKTGKKTQTIRNICAKEANTRDYLPKEECTEAWQFIEAAKLQLIRIRKDDPKRAEVLQKFEEWYEKFKRKLHV